MTTTPQETPAILLEGVRKFRGDFELGPVDLRIEPGQVVAMVSPNGSGKSTLSGMLMNLLKPSSGEPRLFGRSYPDDEVRIKRSIGYVPGVSGSSRVSQPRSCKRSSATPRSRRLSTLTATYLPATIGSPSAASATPLAAVRVAGRGKSRGRAQLERLKQGDWRRK